MAGVIDCQFWLKISIPASILTCRTKIPIIIQTQLFLASENIAGKLILPAPYGTWEAAGTVTSEMP